jgi:addiction module RelE/StbE family toxin
VTYRVILLDRAVRDIDEICDYLSQFYPGTAGRFLEVLEKALDNAANNPRIYPVYEGNKKYRKIVVHNYLVFYMISREDRTIRVYRVLHGKRDITRTL